MERDGRPAAGHVRKGGEREREVGVMEKPGRDIGEGKQGDKERGKKLFRSISYKINSADCRDLKHIFSR